MPIQIEVQDAHAELLVDFYLKRLKSLRDEIVEREREMKDINSIIHRLKKKNPIQTEAAQSTLPVPDYSEKWPWVKKIEFAITTQGKPLTTKEIVETLTEFEPSFLFDRKRVVASVSSILSTKSGQGKDFIRVDSETGDFAYDLNRPEEEDNSYSSAVNDFTNLDDLPF